MTYAELRQLVYKRWNKLKLAASDAKAHAEELQEFDERCAAWIPLELKPDEPKASWTRRAAVEECRVFSLCRRQDMVGEARYRRLELECEGKQAEAQKLWQQHLEKLKRHDQKYAALFVGVNK